MFAKTIYPILIFKNKSIPIFIFSLWLYMYVCMYEREGKIKSSEYSFPIKNFNPVSNISHQPSLLNLKHHMFV